MTKSLVVLTGFEPFAEFNVNPSWETAKALDNRTIDSFRVKSFQVPLVYRQIKPEIERILETQRPAVVINLGQSYRSQISLERVAINLADLTESKVLYNCGTRPGDEILEPNGPAAYFTTLPVREILNRLLQNHIPAEMSYTAGTFGCNQVFFHMMHKIHNDNQTVAAGLIHVPSLPAQAAQLQVAGKPKIPSASLETTIKGIEVAIRTTIERIDGSLTA